MTFEELYHTYHEQIYKFCYRYVGDDQLAGDLCQDTFLKLFQRMRTSEQQIENPKSWLYKVAANLSLNCKNVNQRRNEIEKEIQFPVSEHANPESILVASEKSIQIRAALAGLKPEKRLLLLMYQDGLSYNEMSEATGIALNSIGKTLWRTIEKVSEMIKDENHG